MRRVIDLMCRIVFIIVIWFFPFLLQSCGEQDRRQLSKVDNITFYAMPKGIDRPVNLVSFQELIRNGRDSLITDRVFIRRFTKMVNGLVPDNERESIDMRSAAIIAMKTGDSLFVAFGEKWGTVIMNDNGKDKWEYDEVLGFPLPSVHVNGVFMKDNSALFRFIDKYVYGPHTNDYWLDDDTKEVLKYIREENID